MRSTREPSGLVTSGLLELAAAALSGWIFALAQQDGERARVLGIKSAKRIRQWHLDLAMLGTASIAVGLAVPDAPRKAQHALGVGAWVNAMLFLPLAFRPQLIDSLTFRVASVASFATTTVGFTGMAAAALGRRRYPV